MFLVGPLLESLIDTLIDLRMASRPESLLGYSDEISGRASKRFIRKLSQKHRLVQGLLQDVITDILKNFSQTSYWTSFSILSLTFFGLSS